MIIDGKADEIQWQNATSIRFIKRNGSPLDGLDRTDVKLLHDEHSVFIYAKLYDSFIKATIDSTDANVYFDNAFEVFLDPDGDTEQYIEIQWNARGTVCDLVLNRPYRSGGKSDKTFDVEAMQYAIHHEGTLNNNSDRDSFWSIEIAIPKSSITQKNGLSSWRMNFARSHWNQADTSSISHAKQDNAEFSCWSAPYSKSLHEPEKWGFIYFDKKATVSRSESTIFGAKCLAYHLYYQFQRPKIRKSVVSRLEGQAINLFDKKYLYSYQIENKKFNIIIFDNEGQRIASINEKGDIVLE